MAQRLIGVPRLRDSGARRVPHRGDEAQANSVLLLTRSRRRTRSINLLSR